MYPRRIELGLSHVNGRPHLLISFQDLTHGLIPMASSLPHEPHLDKEKVAD